MCQGLLVSVARKRASKHVLNSNDADLIYRAPARDYLQTLKGIRRTIMMDHMGWMSGGMGLIGVLIIAVLILAIAALIKYLRSHK